MKDELLTTLLSMDIINYQDPFGGHNFEREVLREMGPVSEFGVRSQWYDGRIIAVQHPPRGQLFLARAKI